jgi:hypothetical protein
MLRFLRYLFLTDNYSKRKLFQKMRKELETKIHRTWIELLKETGYRELVAAVLDAELCFLYGDYNNTYGMSIDLPPSSYALIMQNETHQQILIHYLAFVAKGRIHDQNGNEEKNPHFEFRMKLLDVEYGWENIMRELIANYKNSNQASITELMFKRDHKETYLYNIMKFASQSEIRIAQALEARQVLFFPLPLAVRYDTGKKYQDYREPDFLICNKGVFGIIEVSYHPDRFEKDAEKDIWFKKSGILCIQHYTAEKCYKEPDKVVNEFLEILSKYKNL